MKDRNRANAAKSTGPKTSRGKAVSAQNARRHGATSAPEPSAVSTWLSVILDRPHILPSDLMPMDEVGRTALNLAQAEARLAAAEQALAEFEAAAESPESGGTDLNDLAEHIHDALSEPWTTPRQRTSGIAILARIAKARLRDAAGQARRHRLLARYARSARSRAITRYRCLVKGPGNRSRRSRNERLKCQVPKRSQFFNLKPNADRRRLSKDAPRPNSRPANAPDEPRPTTGSLGPTHLPYPAPRHEMSRRKIARRD